MYTRNSNDPRRKKIAKSGGRPFSSGGKKTDKKAYSPGVKKVIKKASPPRLSQKITGQKATGQKEQSQKDGPQRLQKVLAAAGLGSRRQCEELITTGRVEIDRHTVTELGTRVDPAQQEIRVDGQAISQPRLYYYAVHKPVGILSTNRDPSGRPRVIDLLPVGHVRLFTIGRLDQGSEGLILVTNDGELANRLTHPRYGVKKTYRVQVAGRPTTEVLLQLRRGVRLAEGYARVEDIRVQSHHKESSVLEMVLREGKNREIRRILARLGHKVMRLVRTAVGPIHLGELPAGAFRALTREEVKKLKIEAGSSEKSGASRANLQME
jgi:23S rRNA pseudouridine2605 synthase